jgi:hypothetical protein
VIYLCAPAARRTVAKAREALGSSGARIEIRLLPPGAAMPAPARHKAARVRSAAALPPATPPPLQGSEAPPAATPPLHRGAAP